MSCDPLFAIGMPVIWVIESLSNIRDLWLMVCHKASLDIGEDGGMRRLSSSCKKFGENDFKRTAFSIKSSAEAERYNIFCLIF